MTTNRDNFPAKIVESLKKRASFICSNPSCKKMTVAPSETDDEKVLYIGRASHISAASKGGPRFNANMTEGERKSINNAIFLCSNCADMIDDNNGMDFSEAQLKEWKSSHEKWVHEQLNKPIEKSTTHQVFNVSSTNQSGGITAGVVVNFEKPNRHINKALIEQLSVSLPDQNENISIFAQMEDNEALTFAEEIRRHLVMRGFNIEGVGQITTLPPTIGLKLIRHFKGGRRLIVGSQR